MLQIRAGPEAGGRMGIRARRRGAREVGWHNGPPKMMYHKSMSIDRRDADGRELHNATGA